MFSLICVWINDWVNNREAGDLRRYRANYDVIVMKNKCLCYTGMSHKSWFPFIRQWFLVTIPKVPKYDQTGTLYGPSDGNNMLTYLGRVTHLVNCVIIGEVMACRLFGAKPSPQAVMTHCQLDKLMYNSNQTTNIFTHANAFENVSAKWGPVCLSFEMLNWVSIVRHTCPVAGGQSD